VITPQDFVARWNDSTLREQQAAQSHFNELCEMVGFKTPTQLDPKGEFFTFEEKLLKATGGKGRADVWYRGHFAWEYKGKHKDLDEAYAQLLAYKGALGNPPLLVVSDFLEYRIYPQWVNTSGLPFKFTNNDLLNPEIRRFIVWLLQSPDKFLELRQNELEQREKITLNLAYQFAQLADLLRDARDAAGQPVWETMQIARFLTKLVFAFFVEDVELLPSYDNKAALRFIIENAINMPTEFAPELRKLFEAMGGERPAYFMKFVPYFNGGIFGESKQGANDQYEVLDLSFAPDGLAILLKASQADWRFVNPTIFGTLFEGALDTSKRSQLGAHYTSEADIRLILEPVLMRPLYRQWETIQTEAQAHLQAYLLNLSPKERQNAEEKLLALREKMLTAIANTTVLDPACGSGNFLYMSLRFLKDLEGKVKRFFEILALPFADYVTPRQLFGIEKDEFAANLAKVVVWIGYLQWRYEDSGILHAYNPNKIQNFPDALPHPIIKDKNHPDEAERIICADAILRYAPNDPASVGTAAKPNDSASVGTAFHLSADSPAKPNDSASVGTPANPNDSASVGTAFRLSAATPTEPEWPAVDVIVGNPPFLGDKKMRGEMGDKYVTDLRKLYASRIAGQADLVTYWYEKARKHIEVGKAKRVGLLATNSIKQSFNQEVLKRIKETGDIFMAWSDRAWVLEGADVRVSMVGFDDGSETEKTLDGSIVGNINADLTHSVDVTQATRLLENEGLCFLGMMKSGPFDIDEKTALLMLKASNPNQKSNSDVVKQRIRGIDVVRKAENTWIIDFGSYMSQEEASQYVEPFNYVLTHVKPLRDTNNRKHVKDYWWRFGESSPALRKALAGLERCIITPEVAKHRVFIWINTAIIPDHTVHVIARDDDYFFGVLHSKVHEIWSLHIGSNMGKGNDPRYTSTKTFKPFPFPFVPNKEDTASALYNAVAAAAKQLHEERQAWLEGENINGTGGKASATRLKDRTLTNLYNALNVFRGKETLRPKQDAGNFAPRLAELHDTLDKAVCDAYGWPHDILNDEEAILSRLLSLNLERAGH
jgi:hypothetical protein